MHKKILTDSDKTESDEILLSLFERYASYAAQAGKVVHRLSESEARLALAKLPSAHKPVIIQQLDTQLAVFEEILAAKESLNDAPKLLWRFLNRLHCTPCSDIFDKIGDTDIVEVYGADQIHIFQNLNFFDWISVPLERVLTLTWFESSRRDPAVEQKIHSEIARIFNGEVSTYDPRIPWHWLEEVGTAAMYRFELRVKWASPIFCENHLAGFIVVNECRNLIAQNRVP